MPVVALEDVLQHVAANIRLGRKRRDLTQAKLAELVGVDLRYLQRLEKGTTKITLATLVRVSNALGMRPGELLRSRKLVVPPVGRPSTKRRTTGKRKT